VTTLPRKIYIFGAFCALLLSFALPAITTEAATAASSPASAFVQKLGETALMSLTEKGMPRTVRERRVREILRANFDIPTIGRFALGTYWRDASETQRQEYMDLFEDMIVQTYTSRFEDYSGQKLLVDGTATQGKDFIVSSEVLQKDGAPVRLEWRVRNKDEGMKVVDVLVEGVSMSVTQREDFKSVIQHNGGKVEALLATMRQRKKSSGNL
jgi:phospholipid transport system substrate-binding protein